jgi:1-deoxy-D-xylulose-5-phosphate synthase
LAASNERIVAITAAMPDGTGLGCFKSRYPSRFFDVGIAEGHGVTFAAGLAKGGMRPVMAVYSSFLQRAYDQILHDVCIQNLPVVFAIDRAGAVGEDGETHQGLYDLAFLSHIPNMTLLAPKNQKELAAMLEFAINHEGPVAIRYPRAPASRVLEEQNPPIEYGRTETITHGEKVAIISVGAMMDTAVAVSAILEQQGLAPGLFNARFVKPIDMKLVNRLAHYPYVFVLEEAVRAGGYGAKLLESLACLHKPWPMPYFHSFAFPDAFIEHGTREELHRLHKLDADSIAAHILQTITQNKEK